MKKNPQPRSIIVMQELRSVHFHLAGSTIYLDVTINMNNITTPDFQSVNSSANFPKIHTKEGNRKVFYMRASTSCHSNSSAPPASRRHEVSLAARRTNCGCKYSRASKTMSAFPPSTRHSPTAVTVRCRDHSHGASRKCPDVPSRSPLQNETYKNGARTEITLYPYRPFFCGEMRGKIAYLVPRKDRQESSAPASFPLSLHRSGHRQAYGLHAQARYRPSTPACVNREKSTIRLRARSVGLSTALGPRRATGARYGPRVVRPP
jgi:hypothetical protein